MAKAHLEKNFEDAIEAHLVANGYRRGHSSDYDRDRALLPDDVIEFVEATQPKRWEKLRGIHGAQLQEKFFGALCKALRKQGVLDVLRRGFRFYGQPIRLAYFRPAHGLNPDVLERYRKNRLTVVRQLRYDLKNDNSLDLVLFLNGIPVVTAELKAETAGQTVENAKWQYKKDRDPQVPIFRFKERAIVHFAVDADEAWMATRLAKGDTNFLPFNKGHRGGGGNPPGPVGEEGGSIGRIICGRRSGSGIDCSRSSAAM